MLAPGGKDIRIAITAQSKDEAAMIQYVAKQLGFSQTEVFRYPRAALEEAQKKTFQLFITHQEFPDMTGLTMIQTLRESNSYGTENHLVLADKVNPHLLILLVENNIKYVVQKPFNGEIITQKLTSLWQDEIHLTSFERDFREAFSAFKNGDAEKAYDLALKALSIHKLYEKLLLLLGDIEVKTGRHTEARKFFEKARVKYPESHSATHKLAQIHMQEGNYAEATLQLDYLHQLNPLNIQILAHTGRSNFEIGKFKEAKFAMNQLRILDYKRKDANEILARIAIIEENYQEAVKLLRIAHDHQALVKVIKIEGDSSSSKKSHLKTIDMYHSIIAILESEVACYELYYQLGKSYTVIHDHANAIKNMRRSLELKPDFEPARLALKSMPPLIIPPDLS